MQNITDANKMDMTYYFYIKPNTCALERKLNAMVNKKQKFDQ